MMRVVGSKLPVLLSLALASALACGGGDKGADTTPSANQAGGDQGAAGSLSEQLAQADKVWEESCTTCHGESGEGKGRKNPAVVGGKALDKFKDAGELLTYLREKMPKDDPASLPERDYLAITAWLLSKNGKLGDATSPLTAESAAAIEFE